MPNINTTVSTASTAKFNLDYYDRKLLEVAKTKWVHQQFGQKRTIPKNEGKTVKFRRYELFTPDAVTQKLTEGVKPAGQTLSQTEVNATVDQYGAYVEISDLLDLTAADPVIRDSVELLGEQLGTVVDWVTRDAMRAGASAHYAASRLNMKTITGSDKMTIAEIRKAVKTLKKSKARPFGDGNFVCIVDPDVSYDIQNDQLWKDIAVHADPERAYRGEIGRLFGIVFVETTEGYVSEQSVLNAVSAATTASTAFVLKNDPTDAEVAYLSKGGNKIKIGSTEYTLASTGSYTAATQTVTLSAAATLTADAVVYSEDAGACAAADATVPYKGTDVHHTMLFGSDAYGVIDIAGSGAIKSIIKPLGSAGTADPLDQISTVGAKVLAYTAKVLNNLWILDVQSAAS